MNRFWPSRNPLTAFWIVSILALLLYSVVYLVEPRPGLPDEIALNVIYLAAVISPAVVASLVLRSYDPTDPPIRIWKYFAYGFWAWAAAEVIWVIYNMLLGNVPSLNLADPFYILGYVLMTFSVAIQYRQARYQSTVSEQAIVLIIWVSMLLISTLLFFVTILVPSRNLSIVEYIGAYLNIVNGLGDITLALAAILLVTLFQGGALGRPWWGFIILALADAFYGWLTQTGAYNYQVLSGDFLRLTSDLIYMLAYLVIAYSFLRQYVLLRFGPSVTSAGRAP